MKRRLFSMLMLAALACISPGSATAQAPWMQVSSGTTASLFGIHFGSPMVGAAVGGNTIVTTTDGGATWIPQTVGGSLYGVFFANAQYGWAVGGNGVIRRTNDGGANWTAQTSGTSKTLTNVFFISPSTGWAVGYDGILLSTTDSGANWTIRVLAGGVPDLNNIYFVSPTHGWIPMSNSISGGTSNMFATTDGGANWTLQTHPTGNYYAVHFISPTQGWACGGPSGKMMTTANGGATWTSQPTGLSGYIQTVQFTSASEGWMSVVVPGGNSLSTIRKTTDGGASWDSSVTSIPTQTTDLFFISQHAGWACGTDGHLFRYGSVNSIDGRNAQTTAMVSPNPATITATLTVGRPMKATTITLRNLNGQAVREWRRVDGNSFTMDVSGLAAGLYIVEVACDANVQRLKLAKQ